MPDIIYFTIYIHLHEGFRLFFMNSDKVLNGRVVNLSSDGTRFCEDSSFL